ncbi:DUF2867 domain-containing protein [Aliarcobacter cryaerophilus]|uniref:DUF2867 domain-containing protein n=1 Tax=Aliarcobacter cryaerophilus TaxID=28198 RepID=UPI003BAEE6BA
MAFLKEKKLLNSNLEDSKVFNFIENIDYMDTFSVELTRDSDIKDLYLCLVNTKSRTIEFLMSLRNKIMSLFGFKTEIINSNNIKDIQVGNKVGFFNIYFINEHEIIAGEEDKHLNFLVSFYKRDTTLIVTTLVKYNNIFGKIYMTFVKPFHKIVVKNMLKNLK